VGSFEWQGDERFSLGPGPAAPVSVARGRV